MITYQKIIDITLPLNEKTIVYPGNPPVTFEHFGSASGSSFNTKISMSSHSGTHMDAPAHAFKDGSGVDKIDLSKVIGPCRVLDFSSAKTEITVENLQQKKIKKGERILLKTTNSSRGYKEFYNDYIYVSGEGAMYLADRKIALVGIDALSIKKRGLPDNTAHTALLSKGIPVLEGINLHNVEEGEYFLVAAPLPFTGLDGSPLRAVLLK
jgi:arylformamidase